MSQNGQYEYDDDPVEKIIDRAYVDAGHTKVVESAVVRDDDKMKARAFEIVKDKVVSDPRQKSAQSISRGELFAAVFSGGPGITADEVDALSPEEYEARSKLVRRVWNLTNPSRSGYAQKRLGDNGTLVLCRTKVMRDLDEVDGCYVTDDADLIVVDSLRPQIETMVRQANNVAKHFEMLGGRHPELEKRMLGELGSGINKAVAALPREAGTGTDD